MGNALTDYRQALEELFQRTTGGSKFGLERTLAVLKALGDPHRAIRSIHIAGTNGKGSVALTLATVLRERGFRVGVYTSPHLVDFRERVLVNGNPVAEETVKDFIQHWMSMIVKTGATFFEATTAMAFDIFAQADVDIAVVETGLGGRLDSTNVLMPLASVVTSIGIDHVEYLGDTKEAIAREKAGIFKRGVPAVIGEPDPAIIAVLFAAAKDAGAPAHIRAEDWDIRDIRVAADGTRFRLVPTLKGRIDMADYHVDVHTALVGAHQASNAATALLALDALPAPFQTLPRNAARSLPNVRLPGRFHRHGKFIFDVAHNRDGAAVLAATLRAVRPASPVVALLCVLGDKDWKGMMEELEPVVDSIVTTQAPTAPASRAWDPEVAASHGASRGWRVTAIPDFAKALETVSGTGETVVITGSFHTVGDAMARLQVSAFGG